jgi:peroxiredoxin
MRKFTLAPFTLLFAAVLMSIAFALTSQAADHTSVGAQAPSFSLQDQNGKTVSLSDYAGKVIVLEWFNENCPFVQRHYKEGTMNNLASKYAGKDVVWLAVNSTSGTDNASNKKAADAWNMDRPILNDSDGTVGHEYGATNTPDMFIIGKDGKIAYMGGIDNDPDGDKSDKTNYVDQALGEILAGSAVSTPQTKPYGCSVHYAK